MLGQVDPGFCTSPLISIYPLQNKCNLLCCAIYFIYVSITFKTLPVHFDWWKSFSCMEEKN